ncbi:M24 family metallopeptidase [Streptococcus loxodontisalivarius]|uniref:M24 family metallopeptidase n=1 Tax=Streptococcus loxodontisalivarius TaxID=1349415 RepID=UPI0030B80E4E
MEARLKKVEEKLEANGLDGIIISGQRNVYYVTGFWGTESTVFIGRNRRIFLTDARYTLIAKQSITAEFEIVETRSALTEIIKLLEGSHLKTIGFDEQVTYADYQTLSQIFQGFDLQAQHLFLEDLRIIKDESEIAAIRKACQISDKAFIDVLDFIKPGQTTEMAVNHFLDARMRQYGAECASFEFIVASGYRSAMPHGVASDKIIQSGETLTLDFGCYYDHYVSDMTRTVHVGHVTDEERLIYETVLAANQALIDAAKAGVTYRQFDQIPRQLIQDAGFGDYFTHGIGHGIGLDIHEYPYFGTSDETIKPNMVLTDEPGIYIPDKYGVRIEDDLLITEDGCEVLTLAPKELIVIK